MTIKISVSRKLGVIVWGFFSQNNVAIYKFFFTAVKNKYLKYFVSETRNMVVPSVKSCFDSFVRLYSK